MESYPEVKLPFGTHQSAIHAAASWNNPKMLNYLCTDYYKRHQIKNKELKPSK
jgi:hypothetical protein